MKKRSSIILTIIALFVFSLSSFAADPIQLPSPQMDGGKPLMQVLKDRRTTRTFAQDKISMQTLSNLLWAAFGINRPDGRRTAPSAKNWQEIDIYIATAEGLFLWDAHKNALDPISTRDLRGLTGTQAYVGEAAVNLVYVADHSKISGGGTAQDVWIGADVGVISQNVYLFCASEGLATVVRANIDRVTLAKELKLRPEQKIVLAQSVGYPKK